MKMGGSFFAPRPVARARELKSLLCIDPGAYAKLYAGACSAGYNDSLRRIAETVVHSTQPGLPAR